MCTQLRTAIALAFLLAAPAPLRAQTHVDASGHWQGSVSSPQGELRFEVDLVADGRGGYGGTVDIPAEKIVGLPLREVTVRGQAIEFNARTDQEFRGEIAAGGEQMAGTFSIEGNALPFALTRIGVARVRPAIKGGSVTKALEGTWNGTMASNGMRLVLRLSNGGDGTSTAVLVNLDEGSLQIPAAATQHDSRLTLEIAVVGGTYSGTVNGDGSEIVGQYTQGGRSAPLTFRRADAPR